jgi:hypothetical protein
LKRKHPFDRPLRGDIDDRKFYGDGLHRVGLSHSLLAKVEFFDGLLLRVVKLLILDAQLHLIIAIMEL